MLQCLPEPRQIRCGRGIVGLRSLCRRKAQAVCWPDIEAAIARYCSNALRPPLQRRPPDLDETVARLAQLSGMSREGFSRHFKRAHGLCPQAFQIMARLNSARELLREGKSPSHRRVGGGIRGSKPYGPLFPPFFWSHPRPVPARESHIRSRNPPPIRYRLKQRYPLLRRLLWKI